ncbi:MAG: ABC transporter ATP-binding protein [Burkholderiales bacterium]|nr:ABC transporter ATP-binding protein [Burkholderiales bacterium]
MNGPVLEAEHLTAGYGDAIVLEDVALAASCEGVALLGRNGAGKSTLIAALLGLAQVHSGTVRFDGHDVTRWSPQRRARAGIAWVPQERGIFPSLTVTENLTVVGRPGPWTLGRVHDLFPRLAERQRHRGGQLSGGEQQMLAIGRALMLNPKVLLLDEPFEGLAPIVVDELEDAIRRLVAEDVAILLVEQHVEKALALTAHAAVLDRGRLVWQGHSSALAADADRIATLMGFAAA